MKFIKDDNINNKKIILRLDLNVTIKDGKILDNTKLIKSLDIINYLLNNNNKLLIMSHLGKVKNIEDKNKNDLSLVCLELSKLLNKNIKFINKTNGNELNNWYINNEIAMMQNTRYEDLDGNKESKCDMELSKYWSTLGDIFVIDAFGTTHRRHASTYGISKFIPSYYGILINEELNGLNELINIKKRPFTVIMGGAKVDDKIALIESLLKTCDYLIVGGGIANTFLKASGYNIGSSLYSKDFVDKIKELINNNKGKIIMPSSVIVLNNDNVVEKNIDDIEDNDIIYDIGNISINEYKNIINKSSLLFVNGTVGLYEDERFANGTYEILKAIKESDCYSIAGGGDAVASVNKFGLDNAFNFISTGGGATLEYISDKKIKIFED